MKETYPYIMVPVFKYEENCCLDSNSHVEITSFFSFFLGIKIQAAKL